MLPIKCLFLYKYRVYEMIMSFSQQRDTVGISSTGCIREFRLILCINSGKRCKIKVDYSFGEKTETIGTYV
jgi:hypothetical protein